MARQQEYDPGCLVNNFELCDFCVVVEIRDGGRVRREVLLVASGVT